MTVLAHQGGWDEILLVLIPVAAMAALLALVQVRVKRQAAARRAGQDETAGPEG